MSTVRLIHPVCSTAAAYKSYKETWLQESVQAAQEQKAAVETQSSRVTFEVEVLHFQAYLQAEMAQGRFLLAAEKGRVEGRSMPHLLQNLTTLTLDQVAPTR